MPRVGQRHVLACRADAGGRGGRAAAASDEAEGELAVPKALRGTSTIDKSRIIELSRASGAKDGGNAPCYGVLDFPDMKAARAHPAEDELSRMVRQRDEMRKQVATLEREASEPVV